MKSIQVREPGGPEKLELVETATPQPGPKQALVRIAASGVNFIDVYFRTGLYKAELPVTLGSEGAGTVEASGSEVTEVAPGDRVAWAGARGSYAEYALVPAAQLVKLPDGRRGHAPGDDRALSHALHLCAEERRRLPGARRGRRRRRADRADGQDARRARIWHGFHRRESGGGARTRRGRGPPLYPDRFRNRGEAPHRRARRGRGGRFGWRQDRKSTGLNSSHGPNPYAVARFQQK